VEKKKCCDRERDEEQAGIETFGRQPRNEKRQQQDGRQQKRQIYPPPFGFWIKAVNELGDLRVDERPARPD
jgi:hypothetical protein